MKRKLFVVAALVSVAGLVLGFVNRGYASPGPNELASITGASTQGNGASGGTQLSKDGRYIIFGSSATNLVSGDTNTKRDIFVRDRTSGSTIRVSVDSSGGQGNGDCFDPRISADGRYVVFDSTATNLVASVPGGYTAGVFFHDMSTGTTELIANATSSSFANGPDVSDDGRFVVYSQGPTANSNGDVFVKDRLMNTTEQENTSASGTPAASGTSSDSAYISGDGRYVVFRSDASNLVSGDINGKRDVFLVDRLGGHTIQDVTIGANGHSQSEQLSEDGNYILFDSLASNLVSGDTNNNYDVFVYDVKGATYTRASVTNSGAEGNNESDAAGISADGRYVAFDSLASNLVSGDTNGKFDIFIRDLTGGTTELVSQDSGVIGNGDSANAAISGDGKVALYQSDATNLVASDTNGVSDVFVSPTGGVCSTY